MYLIALHWFPDRRKRFEKHLLELYRTELDQNGVIYAADDLALDYRLQVLRTIVVPIMFHERNVDAGILVGTYGSIIFRDRRPGLLGTSAVTIGAVADARARASVQARLQMVER